MEDRARLLPSQKRVSRKRSAAASSSEENKDLQNRVNRILELASSYAQPQQGGPEEEEISGSEDSTTSRCVLERNENIGINLDSRSGCSYQIAAGNGRHSTVSLGQTLSPIVENDRISAAEHQFGETLPTNDAYMGSTIGAYSAGIIAQNPFSMGQLVPPVESRPEATLAPLADGHPHSQLLQSTCSNHPQNIPNATATTLNTMRKNYPTILGSSFADFASGCSSTSAKQAENFPVFLEDIRPLPTNVAVSSAEGTSHLIWASTPFHGGFNPLAPHHPHNERQLNNYKGASVQNMLPRMEAFSTAAAGYNEAQGMPQGLLVNSNLQSQIAPPDTVSAMQAHYSAIGKESVYSAASASANLVPIPVGTQLMDRTCNNNKRMSPIQPELIYSSSGYFPSAQRCSGPHQNNADDVAEHPSTYPPPAAVAQRRCGADEQLQSVTHQATLRSIRQVDNKSTKVRKPSSNNRKASASTGSTHSGRIHLVQLQQQGKLPLVESSGIITDSLYFWVDKAKLQKNRPPIQKSSGSQEQGESPSIETAIKLYAPYFWFDEREGVIHVKVSDILHEGRSVRIPDYFLLDKGDDYLLLFHKSIRLLKLIEENCKVASTYQSRQWWRAQGNSLQMEIEQLYIPYVPREQKTVNKVGCDDPIATGQVEGDKAMRRPKTRRKELKKEDGHKEDLERRRSRFKAFVEPLQSIVDAHNQCRTKPHTYVDLTFCHAMVQFNVQARRPRLMRTKYSQGRFLETREEQEDFLLEWSLSQGTIYMDGREDERQAIALRHPSGRLIYGLYFQLNERKRGPNMQDITKVNFIDEEFFLPDLTDEQRHQLSSAIKLLQLWLNPERRRTEFFMYPDENKQPEAWSAKDGIERVPDNDLAAQYGYDKIAGWAGANYVGFYYEITEKDIPKLLEAMSKSLGGKVKLDFDELEWLGSDKVWRKFPSLRQTRQSNFSNVLPQ